MADLFLKEDVQRLLKGKFVLMIGDSNIKSFYKDLLHLYVKNDIAPSEFFRITPNQDRMESCLGDHVLRIPEFVTPGRDTYEEREFKDDFVHIRFHFITKAFGKTMRDTFKLIEDGIIPMPNIIVMNSCVWDLTRWGPKQEDNYKRDLISLFGKIKNIASEDTLTIWCSTLPIAVQQCKGGILIEQLEFMKHSLRFMVLEANKFTQQLCIAFGIDFLDLHYHMRFQLQRRAIDGIHWETHAIRLITCLTLTHIGLSFEIPLPGYMAADGIDYVRDVYDKAAEAHWPSPLNEIGFQKDIQDKIETELKNCNINKEKVKERVFRNARRRGNATEDNRSDLKHHKSNSGKFSPIRWPQEKKSSDMKSASKAESSRTDLMNSEGGSKTKEVMDYDAFNILKTQLRLEKSKNTDKNQNSNPRQAASEASSNSNTNELSPLELYKMLKEENVRRNAALDSASLQMHALNPNANSSNSNFPAIQSSLIDGHSRDPVIYILDSSSSHSNSRSTKCSSRHSARCSRSSSRSSSYSTRRSSSHSTSRSARYLTRRSCSTRRSSSRSTSRSAGYSVRRSTQRSNRYSRRRLISWSRSASRSTSHSGSASHSPRYLGRYYSTKRSAQRSTKCSISRSRSLSRSRSARSLVGYHSKRCSTRYSTRRSVSRSISHSHSTSSSLSRSTSRSTSSSVHKDASGLCFYLDHCGSKQHSKEKISQDLCVPSSNDQNIEMPTDKNDFREWLSLQQLENQTAKEKQAKCLKNVNDKGKLNHKKKLATARLSPTTVVMNNLIRKRRGKMHKQTTDKLNPPLNSDEGRVDVGGSAHPSEEGSNATADPILSKMFNNNETEPLKEYGCHLDTDCYENKQPRQKDTLKFDCLIDNLEPVYDSSITNLSNAGNAGDSISLTQSVKGDNNVDVKDENMNALKEIRLLCIPGKKEPSFTNNKSLEVGKGVPCAVAPSLNGTDFIKSTAVGNSNSNSNLSLLGDSDSYFFLDNESLYPPGLWL